MLSLWQNERECASVHSPRRAAIRRRGRHAMNERMTATRKALARASGDRDAAYREVERWEQERAEIRDLIRGGNCIRDESGMSPCERERAARETAEANWASARGGADSLAATLAKMTRQAEAAEREQERLRRLAELASYA